MKERAEVERKLKKAKQKKIREEFESICKEANLSSKITFTEFAKKFGKDPRFRNVDKSRDRETYFKEFMLELRRKEKDGRKKNDEKVSFCCCYF